jgi:Fe-S cluster assembly ATPase SufC
MIELKVSDIMSFGFHQVMQKITSTPVHGAVASHIYSVTRQIEKVRAQIMKDYKKEISEAFAKRDADGKIIKAENEAGFEVEEEKKLELIKAQKALNDKVMVLNCQPLSAQELNEVKLTASDIASLKSLFAGHIPVGEDEKQSAESDL